MLFAIFSYFDVIEHISKYDSSFDSPCINEMSTSTIRKHRDPQMIRQRLYYNHNGLFGGRAPEGVDLSPGRLP